MSNFTKYRSGLNNVGSYQLSSRPYLTSSLTIPASSGEPLEVSFDNVSCFVVISNTIPGDVTNIPLRFGFSANGVKGLEDNNYAILNNGESFEAKFRVTKLYLLSDNTSPCSGSVVAGLTGIDINELPLNWSGSLGVG